jgi:hypothetical protein
LALHQPEQYAAASYSDEAYEGALLLAAFMRDVHLMRVSYVKIKGYDPDP